MITPLMSLLLPDVNITPGPLWATELNNALTVIDEHDHTSGKGVKLPLAALNVNADFSLNSTYNLINAKSLRLYNNAALLTASTDIGCVYEKSGDLYYNNSLGNAVQITSGGSIVAIGGGIGGDYGASGVTALAAYSDLTKTFTFTQSTGIAAAIAGGDNYVYDEVAGGKYVKLYAKSGLAGNVNVQLPEQDCILGPIAIQDYTVVGNVGDAAQFMAGYSGWTIAELENYFGGGAIYSYNKFGAGAALGTDEVGTYSYTLGAGAKQPSNGNGLYADANNAISFDGGDYAMNATKFDNFNTIFNGAIKGFIHSFWVIAPTDGQPAAESYFFRKKNNGANDYYNISLLTTGQFRAHAVGNGIEADLSSTTRLPNGANTIWTHIVITWDTTEGFKLYINGMCEASNSIATTVMLNGISDDFYIGAYDTTPTTPFTGRIAQEVVINKVAKQRDIAVLFATTIPEPAVLLSKEYQIIEKVRPEADATEEIQSQCQVLAKYNGKIWLYGRQYGEADTVKLIGQVE